MMTQWGSRRGAGARWATAATAAAVLVLPSAASAWTFGNGTSITNRFSMSGSGRYVAFESDASNLVSDDQNGVRDIFVLDTQTGAVTRVSVSSEGAEGNGSSSAPAINSDGTKVAFQSGATNLVVNDTNSAVDIFVRDLVAGTTVRATVDSSGIQGTGIASSAPAISGDGKKVAFTSAMSNLVPNDTNGSADIFVRDLTAGTTTRVNVDGLGNEANSGISQAPSINSDGTKISFHSTATNLVADDTNGAADNFVRDLTAGTTVRVSVDSSGNQVTDPAGTVSSISGDGTKVVFVSISPALVPNDTNGVPDVFVRDLTAGTTVRVNVGPGNVEADGASQSPAISSDGTKVAFQSLASNLVSGDTGFNDVFVRDLTAGTTARASVGSSGSQANGQSQFPSLSSDGTRVAFQSTASNLVPDDMNGLQDVFVHDFSSSTTTVPVTVSGFAVE